LPDAPRANPPAAGFAADFLMTTSISRIGTKLARNLQDMLRRSRAALCAHRFRRAAQDASLRHDQGV